MPNYDRQNMPPASGPDLLVRRLKAEERIQFSILSESVFGLWVHWDNLDNHSLPCVHPHDNCPGCGKELPRKWKGYLHVGNLHNRRQEFLELTPGPAQQLLDQFPVGQSLRGARIECIRGKGPKARVRLTVLASSAVEVYLPDEVEPTKTLEKLWKLQGVDLRLFSTFADDELTA